MPRETPHPVDLPEPEEPARPALGWTSGIIAIAALLLLAMNGVSLRDWIEDRPPGPLQAQAAMLAERWVGWTEAVGVGQPRARLHDAWKHAEAARFTGDEGQGGGPKPEDQR